MTEKISDAWKIYRGLAVAQLNKKRGGHYRRMLDLVGSLLDGYLDRDKSPAPQDDKYLFHSHGRRLASRHRHLSFSPSKKPCKKRPYAA
jgi:hypothetical protein